MAEAGLVLDAAGLIVLARLGLLAELAAYAGPLLVPHAVFTEATASDRPGSIEIRNAADAGVLSVAATDPGPAPSVEGEAAAIALARERQLPALFDDRQARRIATTAGVRVVGTLAILVELKRARRIARLGPLLDRLTAIGFRMTPELREDALRAADEQ